MTEENSNINQGVPTMMGFDTGPDIETMSPEVAAQEYNAMMKDPKFIGPEYEDNITHTKRVERSQKLFKHGFGEKLAKQKETREEEGRKLLEKENERISERNERDADRKAKDINVRFFGSEELAGQVVEKAKEVVNQLSKADGEFLKVCMPNSELAWGDNPLVIGFLANLRSDPDLIKKVKENGLEHYISLWSKLPRIGVKR